MIIKNVLIIGKSLKMLFFNLGEYAGDVLRPRRRGSCLLSRESEAESLRGVAQGRFRGGQARLT